MLAFFKYSKKEEKFMSDDTVIEEEKEENIIKKVCREHNLTYKKLANELGHSEGSIRSLAIKDNSDMSLIFKKSMELFVKTREYEKELEEFHFMRKWLKKFIFKV